MTVVDLYTIQIIRDGAAEDEGFFPALMDEMEENLTDLLPAGYRARIRRWDDPDPDEKTPEPEPHYHDWKDAYGSVGGPVVQLCECGEYQTIHRSGRITKGEPRR